MDPITAQLLILGITAAYSYWNRLTSHKPGPIRELQVPRVDEGAPLPLFYGRCRVREPILAWIGTPAAVALDNLATSYGVAEDSFVYGVDMFYVVGIQMEIGTATLHKIWASDLPLNAVLGLGDDGVDYVPLSDLVGNGDFERDVRRGQVSGGGNGHRLRGEVELLNGSPTQRLNGNTPTFHATTLAAERMIAAGVDSSKIPGYRNMMSVLMTHVADINPANFPDEFPDGFLLGLTPSVPPFSFEVWSFTGTPLYIGAAGSLIDAGEGHIELNPMDALYDLMTGKVGKLGYPPSCIDRAGTWTTAARTLYDEGNGYSRSIENSATALDAIEDLLQQVRGILFWDPSDDKFKVRLLRTDVATEDIFQIDPSTGCELTDYEVIGNPVPVTSVRVFYSDRQNNYQDNSAVAGNQAAAVSAGQSNEVTMRRAAVCTKQLAEELAGRELDFLSRPLIRCEIKCDRSALRALPGDLVSLTWPEYNVSHMLFRIMQISRGSLSDGKITMQLIQDVAYLHRGVTVLPGFPSFPGGILD